MRKFNLAGIFVPSIGVWVCEIYCLKIPSHCSCRMARRWRWDDGDSGESKYTQRFCIHFLAILMETDLFGVGTYDGIPPGFKSRIRVRRMKDSG